MWWEKIIPLLIAGGIGIAFAGIALLVLNGLEYSYYKITGTVKLKQLYRQQQQQSADPAKWLKEMRQNVQNNRDLINMSVVVFATGFMFALIMPGGSTINNTAPNTVLLETVSNNASNGPLSGIRMFGFLGGAGVGAFFYTLYQKHVQKGVQLKKLKESILIYDALNVYGETGENLPTILEKIVPALDVLKPAVERFLKRYPYGTKEALLEMEKEMNFKEAGLLTSVLFQFIASGMYNNITASEAARIENKRKTIYRTEIAIRPMYRQLVLFIPLGAGIVIVIYAIGRHVLDSLSIFNATQFIK